MRRFADLEISLDDQKRHENEKIFHKAEIEAQRNMVYRLEGKSIQAGREFNRMHAIVEEFVKNNQGGPRTIDPTLQAMVDAWKATCDELKKKNDALESQVKVKEKENLDQKTTLRLRDRIIVNKDTLVKEAENAKAAAERAVDDLYHTHELRTSGYEETLEEQTQQLKCATNKIGDLEAHIESLMQAGFGVEDPETLDRHQFEIVNLQQHVTDLKLLIEQYEEEKQAPKTRSLNGAIHDAVVEFNYEIESKKWADAQEEIQRLKTTLTHVGKGCDVAKFEVAQDYSKLQEKYLKLERESSDREMEYKELDYDNIKLQERYDELDREYKSWLTKTLEEQRRSRAADQKNWDEVMTKMTFLGQTAENLIGHLAQAWCGPGLEVREDDSEAQRRKQSLVDVLVAIRQITGDSSEGEQGAVVEDVEDAAPVQQAVVEQATIQEGTIEDTTVATETVDEAGEDDEDNANSKSSVSASRGQPVGYAFYPTPSTPHPCRANASHPSGQINFVQTESGTTEKPLTATQPGPTFGVDYIAFNSDASAYSDASESEDSDDELYACSVQGEQNLGPSGSVQGGNNDEDSTFLENQG